jgi:GAF domain-containing protein
LGVPLLREGEPIGVIALARQRVEPFTERQIELVSTFADQAVIAMENARLLTETREALERQTAIAEILRVISRSPTDVQPTFDAIAVAAKTLTDAALGGVLTYDGKLIHLASAVGWERDELVKFRPLFPMAADRDSLAGRAILTREIAYVTDMTTDTEFHPSLLRSGGRTALAVPMLRDGVPIGAINVQRRRVEPFSEAQIDLLKTFADQAVIAIENVRLFNETHDALEQQTATAEVLQVINSSPGDLAPVFDAMLDRAMRLCDASFGCLITVDNKNGALVAQRNLPERLREYLTPRPIELDPASQFGQAIQSGRALHIIDVRSSEAYRQRVPHTVAAVELGGVRTILHVPLTKDGRVLGDFIVYRQDVRPFSENQIALLQNFAAQAVIAMENARLLTETREALEQQTATAEVLQVINSSPGDLAPVFEAILKKAHTLCGAAKGAMVVYDGERYRTVAARGLSAAYTKLLRQVRREFASSNSPSQGLLRGADPLSSRSAASRPPQFCCVLAAVAETESGSRETE